MWLLLGSGGVDHDLNAGMPSPRASFGEVDVAWWRYEEADAERRCKEADAEGVALGESACRRKVLRVRERLRSWGAMASELFTFSATDEKCFRGKLTISCAFGLGSGSKEKKQKLTKALQTRAINHYSLLGFAYVCS